MAQDKAISLFHAIASPEMERAALEVLRSGQIASGPKISEFERRIGSIVAGRDVVCTSDMTHALVLALKLAGVQAGDEVLTLAYSCMSSNSAIALVGAKAVWVDLDPATATMSVSDLERALSPSTKAVMLYHVAGYAGPTTQIKTICQALDIALIEDCNNALGATQDGASVGTVGDFAVFSFYPNRQINALEGAALVCPDATSAARARRLRRFGIDTAAFRDAIGEINPLSDIPEIGLSASFSHLSAAIGLSQIDSLADRIQKTRLNADMLREGLAHVPGLEVVAALPGTLPTYWAFLILVDNRDRILARLKEKGIGGSKLHHRNDAYTGFHAQARALPGTDNFTKRVIGLPCGWWLNEQDLANVVAAVESCAA